MKLHNEHNTREEKNNSAIYNDKQTQEHIRRKKLQSLDQELVNYGNINNAIINNGYTIFDQSQLRTNTPNIITEKSDREKQTYLMGREKQSENTNEKSFEAIPLREKHQPTVITLPWNLNVLNKACQDSNLSEYKNKTNTRTIRIYKLEIYVHS